LCWLKQSNLNLILVVLALTKQLEPYTRCVSFRQISKVVWQLFQSTTCSALCPIATLYSLCWLKQSNLNLILVVLALTKQLKPYTRCVGFRQISKVVWQLFQSTTCSALCPIALANKRRSVT